MVSRLISGAIYVHDCPIEKLIPIYLIVGGCSPVLLGGLSTFKKKGDEEDPFESDGKKKLNLVLRIIGAIGFLFNFAWLICGKC